MHNNYDKQWDKIYTAWHNQKMPQALLLIGPLHCNLSDIAIKIAQLNLCGEVHKDNMTCVSCRMIKHLEHPDLLWIQPEKESASIKVEQIRVLQQDIYLSPQQAKYGIITIDSADKMNTFAANALLKILEEPPSHKIFILIAEQLATIPPTIISRCQQYLFNEKTNLSDNLLRMAAFYPLASPRGRVAKDSQLILDGLLGVLTGKQQTCVVAALWKQYDLAAILWFLYLVFAQIQIMLLTKAEISEERDYHQLNQMKSLLNEIIIFKQIDKINNFLKKLNHNISINPLLAIEELLLTLCQ